MRLDKFLTEMGLGTRSEVKKDFENKTDHSQWRDRYKTGNKGCTGKTTRYLIKVNRSLTVNTNIIFL